MALNKVNYVDGQTVITAENLNDIQDAIIALENAPAQGLTEDMKQALLQIARKVAYIDDQGADYYQDLYDALYPPKELLYITAVYTQTGTVYDDASLDSLRTNLVVTAKWEDNTETYVTTYTLSGTLTAGTSTVTVSYNGKTTTFDVTVTARPALSSITAVYTQSGYVFTTDSLDTLKGGLVVTAHYSDSSTATVSSDEYTLSGTLTAGTSTVTVSCGGKTTTFTVTVSEVPSGYNTNGLVFFLDGKTATASSWIDRVGSRAFALTDCSLVTNGVQFNGSSSFGSYQGAITGDWENETIEVVFDGRETITSGCILSQTWVDDAVGISCRFGNDGANRPRFVYMMDGTNHAYFQTLTSQDKNRVGLAGSTLAVLNETAVASTYSTYYAKNSSGTTYLGCHFVSSTSAISASFKGKILAVRIYNRKLSQAEIVANQQVDATYYEL